MLIKGFRSTYSSFPSLGRWDTPDNGIPFWMEECTIRPRNAVRNIRPCLGCRRSRKPPERDTRWGRRRRGTSSKASRPLGWSGTDPPTAASRSVHSRKLFVNRMEYKPVSTKERKTERLTFFVLQDVLRSLMNDDAFVARSRPEHHDDDDDGKRGKSASQQNL